ncbi:Ribokinase-like protein [Scleroderma yunnanense]
MAVMPEPNQQSRSDLDDTTTSSARILSIQSHVAFGYVGGKAAIFPLQCMGYDVDVVNTVNYSNHTGYGHFGGTKTTAEDLTKIFDFMDTSGVLIPSRLLTGYIPNAASLNAVHQLAQKLKARDPNLIYLLDPVLGDSGQLYVPEDVIPVYRKMLSLSTVITPNWFEVEVLTDIKLTDLDSIRRALSKLHVEYQVPNVVISSIPLSRISAVIPEYLLPHEYFEEPINCLHNNKDRSFTPDKQQYLLCIASSTDPNHLETNSPLSTVYARCVLLIPGYFSGVGDLFSALLLGHFHPPSGVISAPPLQSSKYRPLANATAHALSKTHAILSLTSTSAADSLPASDDELDAADPQRRSKRMKSRELKLIQGQGIFRSQKPVEELRVWEGFWNGTGIDGNMNTTEMK